MKTSPAAAGLAVIDMARQGRGLASAGVAVLRFDKVTFGHAEQVGANHNFTLTDEYVPHAAATTR
jgi:hypothetical protein